ncbi:Protein DsrB [Clarias magur]|uniref:Protein DsrB n=1 Tax=Clarias magur TaxID=1594786 RepID=A0A8J4X482_CLAMG|nr:Protein DsrB [Clarias magur]
MAEWTSSLELHESDQAAEFVGAELETLSSRESPSAASGESRRSLSSRGWSDEWLKLRCFILPVLVASDDYLSGVWGFMTITEPHGLHIADKWSGDTRSPPVHKSEILGGFKE